jgi:hypothetical protein
MGEVAAMSTEQRAADDVVPGVAGGGFDALEQLALLLVSTGELTAADLQLLPRGQHQPVTAGQRSAVMGTGVPPIALPDFTMSSQSA